LPKGKTSETFFQS